LPELPEFDKKIVRQKKVPRTGAFDESSVNQLSVDELSVNQLSVDQSVGRSIVG
jgi:hypothetical protein